MRKQFLDFNLNNCNYFFSGKCLSGNQRTVYSTYYVEKSLLSNFYVTNYYK